MLTQATLTAEHANVIKARGLNLNLAVQMGVHSHNGHIAIHYLAKGRPWNTKLRRGKGDMPWLETEKALIPWNADCLAPPLAPDEMLIITEGEYDALAAVQLGFNRVISVPNGAPGKSTEKGDKRYSYLMKGDKIHPDIDKFQTIVLAVDADAPGVALRDALAIRLGDERCLWVEYPAGCKDLNDVLRDHGPEVARNCLLSAKRMWSDEVCRLSEMPEGPPDVLLKTGFTVLDNLGIRLCAPGFMTVLGPYGSGKSVFVRQMCWNIWRETRVPFLITTFEERASRYQRDFRRYATGKANPSPEEIGVADYEIDQAMVVLRRKRGAKMTQDRLLDRIEYAIGVYGVRLVVIDPINEVDHQIEPGQNKTDYMGELIIRMKQICEDYQAIICCVVHPPKSATQFRSKEGFLMTLNDGDGTAHWGNKSDMGFCFWRPVVGGPTLMHIDKLKDHETMGKTNLFELTHDASMNSFRVTGSGYDLLKMQATDRAAGG